MKILKKLFKTSNTESSATIGTLTLNRHLSNSLNSIMDKQENNTKKYGTGKLNNLNRPAVPPPPQIAAPSEDTNKEEKPVEIENKTDDCTLLNNIDKRYRYIKFLRMIGEWR